jgi:cyanophycinase
MMDEGAAPGPVALVGSGEYLPVMEEIDRLLLERVGGPEARVVILPTAAGLEDPGSPARWVQMGLDHFRRLGAQVEAAVILVREHAFEQRWLSLLESADFVYFSGGDPRHLVATMTGTPAWEVIRRRHAAGAALAGCSAGAMAFCGLTASPRAVAAHREAQWATGLGLLPRLIVLPHFDRMGGFVGQETLDRIVRAAPAHTTLLGIDEDTALIHWNPPREPGALTEWQVLGRQTVAVFGDEGQRAVYRSGESVALVAG